MKLETNFDEFGWKIVVEKTKEGIIKISQRNKKSEIHMNHKPMQLRLRKEEFQKMIILLYKMFKKGNKE